MTTIDLADPKIVARLLDFLRNEDEKCRGRHARSAAAGRDEFAAYHGGKAEGYQHVLAVLEAREPLEITIDPLTRVDEAASASGVEFSVGEGLGDPLPGEEALDRLFEATTPMSVRDWAGETISAPEACRRLSISEGLLREGVAEGRIMCVVDENGIELYPVTQFVRGRTVPGIGQVVAMVGDDRTAWLWMTTSSAGLDGERPLDVMARGELGAVIEIAARDFG